jgi:hypothetical protein
VTTYAQLGAQDLNNLYSSTTADFSSDTEKQTFDNAPALRKMTRNKRISSGGLRIEKRLQAGRNTNGKHLRSDADQVELSDQNVLTTAVWPMVFMAIPVLSSQLEQSINSGKQQIVSLVKARITQASDTARDLLSTGLFGDGTDGTMIGLQAIVPDVSGTNTYAGLSESSTPFWVPYYDSSAGSFASVGYLGSSDDKLTRAMLICSDNGQMMPDQVLSDRLGWEAYHRALGQQIRYTKAGDFGDVANSSSSTLKLFGADWDWDSQCPTGHIYTLHTDSFEFTVDPNFNYKWMGPFQLGRQFLLTFDVLTLRYQLICVRRNWQGVTYTWTM